MCDLPCNSGPYLGRNTGRTEPARGGYVIFHVDPTPHSRLACQVELSDKHDGLSLTVAKRQY